jgi:Flp pilus assembly protein CpaB
MSVLDAPEVPREALPVGPGVAKEVRRRSSGTRLTPSHLVPLLLAVISAVLVLVALRDRGAVDYVAVSSNDVPASSALTVADIRWVPVHASDGAATGGLLDKQDLSRAWTTKVEIPSGAPIALDELVPAGPQPSGTGSMSISVPLADADGGQLEPGDRVDIISMTSGTASYIATGLVVLSVADPSRQGALTADGVGGYYLTLAVDRSTALKVAAATASQGTSGMPAIEVVRTTGEAASQP